MIFSGIIKSLVEKGDGIKTMTLENMINFRVPIGFTKAIEHLIQEGEYNSLSDFYRDAVKDKINYLEKYRLHFPDPGSKQSGCLITPSEIEKMDDNRYR